MTKLYPFSSTAQHSAKKMPTILNTHKRFAHTLIVAGLLLTTTACATSSTQPVSVTRFHTNDLPSYVPNSAPWPNNEIHVVLAHGQDSDDLELRTYRDAVARVLSEQGFNTNAVSHAPASATFEVSIEQRALPAGPRNSPVTVGGGAATGTGGWGSSVGLGVGINLSGKPKAQTETQLSAVLRTYAGRRVIWEGRAQTRTPTNSTNTPEIAERLAKALFQNFPGVNGETIEVR